MGSCTDPGSMAPKVACVAAYLIQIKILVVVSGLGREQLNRPHHTPLHHTPPTKNQNELIVQLEIQTIDEQPAKLIPFPINDSINLE